MQNKTSEHLMRLSREKWHWMSVCDLVALNKLFHEKSVFVHMGGTWGKPQELEIIASKTIHYKKADVHDISVQVVGTTGVVLSNITLLAVVGGNEITNPFAVTEVYAQQSEGWTLLALSFTKLLTR